ncbi:HI0074 family nucleotidyltransferase substrate-binding subunit [Acinetobacter bereziniae]|uniref:HI0074 family nucleotidyltransferase substrate-binding subunit n=1 Tax=Acinetobacter bereziniae TaxID=106648 RepID=UPI0012506DB6|nr:HI0074 family nucleotidyltransferase substrate-binding subunit [Acinetobacter bereziniae]MBJ9903480.1 nucleotidyltransferase substrate binding protein [Acinetobacter bereziniae]MCU4319485.1 nucleotidyltransferase substrate binding protein [Acinetobacter bereziniae]MCU4599222.1 nucleotidyltransferase substrate binding protein [Acinetobacter bereziniae]
MSETNSRKYIDSLTNLEKALNKLSDALKIEPDRELVVEGTIQRFEYVVEIFWKTLQRGLEYEGIKIEPNTPRQTLKEALRIGWLDENLEWQTLLDRRNKTSHEYLDEEFITEAYDEIKDLTPHIIKIYETLNARLKLDESK